MEKEKPPSATPPEPTARPEITPQRKPRMSALALAARRKNLEKARAAGREKIYRPTEKRQAASRANLARAIAARNTPSGNASARLNALSHGISAKDVAGSVARLGEDEAEYREHQALFERAFAPQDESERDIVRRLSDASWKRLRFFRAQAEWELSRLKKTLLDIIPGNVPASTLSTLKDVPAHSSTDTPIDTPADISASAAAASAVEPSLPLGVDETLRRAYVLSRALDFNLDLLDYVADFQSEIQGQLKQLLRKRSGGKMRFQAFAKVRGIKKEFEETLDDMLDRALKSKKMTTRLR